MKRFRIIQLFYKYKSEYTLFVEKLYSRFSTVIRLNLTSNWGQWKVSIN